MNRKWVVLFAVNLALLSAVGTAGTACFPAGYPCIVESSSA